MTELTGKSFESVDSSRLSNRYAVWSDDVMLHNMTRAVPIRLADFSEQDVRDFWGLVTIAGPDECWLWTGKQGGGKKDRRYGRWFRNGLQFFAHRVAYVFGTQTEIPAGLTIDHVAIRGCKGGICCNPSHLEPVPFEVNLQRFHDTMPLMRQCPKGHAARPRGTHCKECAVESVARSQRSNPEKYMEMKRLQKRKERERKKLQQSTSIII